MAILLAACGGGGGASSAPAESSESSVASASSEPSQALEPSASAEPSDALALCVPADIFGALEDISTVVEPTVPAEDIADAVEALDVSGFDDDVLSSMQTDLVTRLRDGDTHSFDLQIAAGVLLERGNLTEC